MPILSMVEVVSCACLLQATTPSQFVCTALSHAEDTNVLPYIWLFQPSFSLPTIFPEPCSKEYDTDILLVAQHLTVILRTLNSHVFLH